ncbi:MAG: hypothetical protein HKL95_04980 [Phycisphaerae bacterium]|nr:hypothetical protein [Phycisphaerae bacterium]
MFQRLIFAGRRHRGGLVRQRAFLVRGLLMIWCCLALAVGSAQAQVSSVVHATLATRPTPLRAGESAVLYVRIHVAPGYHIQSAHPYDHFLVATRAVPLPVPGISFGPVRYPKGKDIPASTAITALGKLSVYEGAVKIKIPLRLAANVQTRQSLRVHLITQACDANACFMPATLRLHLVVHIVSAGHKATRAAGATTAGALPAGHPPATYSVLGGKSHTAVWLLVVFALLGGMILNVMPCVLPVIPLKVLSLMNQAHGDKRIAMRHGLFFGLGMVSLFVVLGGVIGLYQWATGGTFLYGSQFQNPVFMLAIGLVLVAFGLSTLGLWTIQPPASVNRLQAPGTGYVASFSTGLLATILATPCSAPFLGSVLAWALLQPSWVVVLFFALIGVGMAAPYVVLAAMPDWIAWVPRAGRWSDILKNTLGFVILAVAVFIFSSLPGRGEILAAINLSLLVGVVCWVWGQMVTSNTPPDRAVAIRGGAVGLALLLGIAVWHWYAPAVKARKLPAGLVPGRFSDDQPIAANRWENFSNERLHAALHADHPVMVDFTASWCINCRAVKAFVLDSPAVRRAAAHAGMVLLSADLTQANPPAQSLLLKLGGRSIPFLAIFSPALPYHPRILRDLYTIDDVLKAVHAAADKK